jgi:hypothetical protein
MSLHVLAYNLKRAMNILGTKALIEAMRALERPSPHHQLKSCEVVSFDRALPPLLAATR